MTTAPTPSASSETPMREALAGTPCSGFFWERYAYSKDKRAWNARRLARARQAVEKESEAMALCPELRRFDTVEDRVAMMDEREIRITNHMRKARAEMWREVRAMIRNLPADFRERLKAKWNTRFMPGTPAHLFACARRMAVAYEEIEEGTDDPQGDRIREIIPGYNPIRYGVSSQNVKAMARPDQSQPTETP